MVDKITVYVVCDIDGPGFMDILQVFADKNKAIEYAINTIDEKTNEQYNHKYIRKILEESMNNEYSSGFDYARYDYMYKSICIKVFEVNE